MIVKFIFYPKLLMNPKFHSTEELPRNCSKPINANLSIVLIHQQKLF